MTILTTNYSSNCANPSQRIQRDYWEIDIFLDNPRDPGDKGIVAMVRGRRRTTEPFWPGLRLDCETLLRFGISIRNAVTIAMGFAADNEDSTNPIYPATDTLAICQGSRYIIETSETLDGFGKRSIGTTIYNRADPMLPSVHLIDDELRLFSKDLEAVIEQLARFENTPT